VSAVAAFLNACSDCISVERAWRSVKVRARAAGAVSFSHAENGFVGNYAFGDSVLTSLIFFHWPRDRELKSGNSFLQPTEGVSLPGSNELTRSLRYLIVLEGFGIIYSLLLLSLHNTVKTACQIRWQVYL
jgi:hypothetical protein